MEFGLLGPLLIRRGGLPVQVPRGSQRDVLAALLLAAGQAASLDQLAEVLWGEQPPPSAEMAVRNYVRRLRQALGDTGRSRIRTQPHGYLLALSEGELDLSRFEALLHSARAAARDQRWDTAARQARLALALWRGEPLADVESDLLMLREKPRLAEMRLHAAEIWADAALHLGSHAEAAEELERLAAAHPLRERLHALLMLARYRAGDPAGALAAYADARRVLVSELGIEPGAELRELHQRILARDRGLAFPGPGPVSGNGGESAKTRESGSVVPRELPGAARDFVGRAAELAALSGLLEQAGDAVPGTVVISAIGGMAGVGKTTLALRWAHQLADRFPDGQLYVNLRGYGPFGGPTEPVHALRGFLDALGVVKERIPAKLDGQAALFRSLLADKRILVVLDNARDEAQVRPLLPGLPSCLVIVTSRNQLTGLAVNEGAHMLTLGLMPENDARQLLVGRLGAERVAAEPGAVDELIGLCGRLPLALAVVAARAAGNPGFPLAGLGAELRDETSRLDALDAGELGSDIRAVFSWSYHALSEPAAWMFQVLGLHPGPDTTIPAAASAAAVPLPAARRCVRELVRAHLLTEHLPGRFGFHDLLRGYAAEQATADGDRQASLEARHRVFDHYLHTAYRAAILIQPQRDPLPVADPEPGVAPEVLADAAQAQAWLQAEYRVLLAAVATAADTGFDVYAWQISWTLAGFLDWRGHWHEAARIQRIALDATVRLGDAAGQAVACRLLAITYWRFGDYEQARAYLEDCVRLSRQRGDRTGEARAQQNLGVVAADQGRYADALGHVEQAHELFLAVDDRAGEASSRSALGSCHILLGDYERARTLCREALALLRELGLRHGEAHAWYDTGRAEHGLGRLTEAADCYQSALSLFRELGHRYYEADVLSRLGDSCSAAGDPQAARETWQQALEILDDLQHPDADKVRVKLR